MVVMWCKSCGALMGVREPMSDWSPDRTGLCPACAKMQLGASLPTNEQEDEEWPESENGSSGTEK
jgi:hypothetical protein